MVSTVSPDFTAPSRNSSARTLLPPMPSLLRSSRLSHSDPSGLAPRSISTGVGRVASRTRGMRVSSGNQSRRGYPAVPSVILLVFDDDVVADDALDVDHPHGDHRCGEHRHGDEQ